MKFVDSRICFGGILFTALACIQTLCLPGLISFIANGRVVGGFGGAFPDFFAVLSLLEIV